VDVRCGLCGERFALSPRREYEYRRQGREPICVQCRRPPRPAPDDRDRAYWLERFSLEEIQELAEAIWA